jgi:urea transporter
MLLLQVVFANNPISGILIFISLTVAEPLVSAAGLLTASVGLLGSIVVSAVDLRSFDPCGRDLLYSLLKFMSKRQTGAQ